MKSVALDAIDAAGDVAGCVAGWTDDETRIGAEDVEARPGDEDDTVEVGEAQNHR